MSPTDGRHKIPICLQIFSIVTFEDKNKIFTAASVKISFLLVHVKRKTDIERHRKTDVERHRKTDILSIFNNNNNNFIYTVNNPISIAAGINGRTVLMNIITKLSTQ